MACLTKNMSFEAIKNMQKFHYDLEEIFTKNGMDFKENLGRRNIVMSHAQEKFFTEALRKKFKRVINDGRTGQPDIVIEDEILGTTKEIECNTEALGLGFLSERIVLRRARPKERQKQ